MLSDNGPHGSEHRQRSNHWKTIRALGPCLSLPLAALDVRTSGRAFSWRLEALRSPTVINDTIGYNILYGRPDVGRHEDEGDAGTSESGAYATKAPNSGGGEPGAPEGAEGEAEREIRRVARLARIDGFVSTLPQGYLFQG